VPDVLAKPPIAAALPSAATYSLPRRANDSYLAVNRLLAAKQTVRASATEFQVPATRESTSILTDLVDRRGLVVEAARDSAAAAVVVAPVRVGLFDQYGGSAPSGWARWILEQFEFPVEVVYPKRLDEGDLARQFDVLLFVGPGIPRVGRPPRPASPPPSDLPAEYADRVGRVSAEQTVPALRAFLEGGGRIVTIGAATALAEHLGLPIENHLVERTPNGIVRPLPRERFYVPASLLEVQVDPGVRVAAGMGDSAIVMFDESPVFRLLPDARERGITPVAWFRTATPLRSGWAWGQTYLEGGIAALQATVGRGTLYLFGPEVTFRGQPHGTFKLLFNAILGE
jgi:hypothetical protein